VKTFVEFRSKKFPPYDGEEEDINPGLWGKRLAEYFVENLPAHGIEPGEIIAEDWGWYIPIPNDGISLGLGCGHQYGDDDEFLCMTDPQLPIVRKLFKKIDATPQLLKLTEAIQSILTSDQDISEISWREP